MSIQLYGTSNPAKVAALAILNRPWVQALVQSGYAADGNNFAGWARPTDITTEVAARVAATESDRIGRDAGAQKAGETAVTDARYPVADLRRYGADVTGALDSTTAIVAAGAYAARVRLRGGVFRVNGTTTITNLRIRAGAQLKTGPGAVVTLAGNFVAEAMQCFDTSLGGQILFAPGACQTLVPEWWGAVGNATADDTISHQACLDAALASNALGGTYKVRWSRRYKTTDSLRAFIWNAGAFSFSQVSIEGSSRGYMGGKSVEIRPTFVDRPALIFQAMRASDLTGVTFVGAIASVSPSYDQLLRDTGGTGSTPWWNPSNLARDTRYSPYCAVSIDPFSLGVPSDGGIPGHSAYYTQNIGSAIINVEKCFAYNFVVGYASSTSDGTLNGEDITFRDCNTENVKVSYALGQSQLRNVNIENCRALYARTMFDGVNYGLGNAPFPNVRGGDVAGGCKWLMIGNSGWAKGSMTQFYGESIWSLGFWGWNTAGFPFTFDNCEFSMIPPQAGVPGPASHLHASGPVIFRGGFFGHYNNVVSQLSIYAGSKCVFDQLDTTGVPVMNRFALARFKGTTLHYNAVGASYGIDERHAELFASFASNAEVVMAPMGEVLESISATEYRRWRYREYEHVIALDGAAAITVNADGTATFTSASAAPLLQVGDSVMARTATWNAEKYDATLPTINYTGLSIGRVKTIVGNDVTLEYVPITMVSGTHNIGIVRLPRFKPRTVGTTISASNVVNNVSPISMWAQGDRISGNSIPAGTYITAKGATTLTLSQNATGTGTAELYDAKLFLEDACRGAVPSADSWFLGDFVRNTGGTKDANNMILSGWRCTVSGRGDGVAPAATFESQYVSAVSPAT